MALDRNVQINPQGDPAREQEFIQNQDVRTTDVARASEPQIVLASNEDLITQVRQADVLDPLQKTGYDAPDAPSGSEQGANVNADFEDNVRTGADASGDAGDAAEAGDAEQPEYGNVVEIADPAGGDLVENQSEDEPAPTQKTSRAKKS